MLYNSHLISHKIKINAGISQGNIALAYGVVYFACIWHYILSHIQMQLSYILCIFCLLYIMILIHMTVEKCGKIDTNRG